MKSATNSLGGRMLLFPAQSSTYIMTCLSSSRLWRKSSNKQTRTATKGLLANHIVWDFPTLSCNYPAFSCSTHLLSWPDAGLNGNKGSGSVPGIDNAIRSLNKAGWRRINSAQCWGFYSLPWPMLMDIDSDLRGAKSWAWRVLISGEEIKLPASGQRRVRIYLSWSSVICESQREADSCGDEPDLETALDAADRKSLALLGFYYIFASSRSEAAVFTWIFFRIDNKRSYLYCKHRDGCAFARLPLGSRWGEALNFFSR